MLFEEGVRGHHSRFDMLVDLLLGHFPMHTTPKYALTRDSILHSDAKRNVIAVLVHGDVSV